MPAQFRGSNDCGIYTCCLAADYLRSHLLHGAFNPAVKQPSYKKFHIRAIFNGPGPEHWGRTGRMHVEKTLRSSRVDPSDMALFQLQVEIIPVTAEELKKEVAAKIQDIIFSYFICLY